MEFNSLKSYFRRHQLLPGFFLLLLAVSSAPVFSQTSGNQKAAQIFPDKIIARAQQYLSAHETEKVYLHFDKSFYFVGDECWYKAYVVNGFNFQPTALSGVLYVDWINSTGALVKHQTLKVDNGEATGTFTFIPDSLAGNYLVRAYTQWMRNEAPEFFFMKTIRVYGGPRPYPVINASNNAKNIDLQFFPEGGTAVNDIQTQVAFKAIDTNGNGTDVSGRIVDEKNETVTQLRSLHNGMGIIPFIPAPGKSYKVILNGGGTFDLPAAATSGVVMNANNLDKEKIMVRIQASKQFFNTDFYLVGQSRGRITYTSKFTLGQNHNDINIPKKDLPGGIMQLTLFDKAGAPLAERMLFVDREENFQIHITSDKNNYLSKDSVSLQVHTSDLQGNPVPTSLSISITDERLAPKDPTDNNLSTHLLLQSDLRGFIENPNWYFNASGADRIYALDLVMLTHGWRKFDWKNILEDTLRSARYAAEEGILLEGKVVKSKTDKRIPKAQLSLMVSDMNFSAFYTTETDGEGRFKIENVDFNDSTILIWQIHNEKGKALDAQVILDDSQNIPEIFYQPDYINYASNSQGKIFDDTTDAGDKKFQLLEQVEITRARKSRTELGYNSTLLIPGKEDYKLPTSQYVSRYALGLPHVKLVKLPDGTEKWVTSEIKGKPLGGGLRFFINGYEFEDKGPASHPFLILNSYRTDQIEYIVVQGDALSGYTISIKTKSDSSEMNKGIIKQFARGYQVTKTFYQPKYGRDDTLTSFPDRRATLYWNPHLLTDKNGRATIQFYNSDVAKKFTVVAEGLYNGLIGTNIKKIGTDKQ